MRAWFPLLVLVPLLSTWPRAAAATSQILLDDVQQARLSTAVVVAAVGDARVGLHPQWGRPLTETVLKVERVLFGEAPAELTVRQFGGEWRGQRTAIPGDAELRRGETCVLFLRHVEDRWVLTALGQSKYLLRDGALTRELGEGFFVRDGQRLKEVEPGVQRTTLEAFAASLEGHVGPLEGRSDSVEGQPATIGDQPMAVEAEPGSRGGGPRSREVSP